jgi:hypothetical protein
MYAGGATSACGAAVSAVHSSVRRGDVPLAAMTVATARPSGTLCSPIASVTSVPCLRWGQVSGVVCWSWALAWHTRLLLRRLLSMPLACTPPPAQATRAHSAPLNTKPTCATPCTHLCPAAVARKADANAAALADRVHRHDC